jgi:23S rRNA pseudouridine2604 synthase
MNIKMDMPVGEYRELTKDEFKELNHLITDSTKEYKPNLVRPHRKRD